jgi:hypothetical protein
MASIAEVIINKFESPCPKAFATVATNDDIFATQIDPKETVCFLVLGKYIASLFQNV